jgi:pimeloyl-ACP methyl ester carboxylesterase
VSKVEVNGEAQAWSVVEKTRAPGKVLLEWHVTAGSGMALELPVCAGRGAVALDGSSVAVDDPGPVLIPLSAGEHVLSVRLTVSGYERRIACGAPLRLGTADSVDDGLLRLSFPSPHASANGGHAVLFVPLGHDATKAGALLVLLHPWNGSIWTYAAYAELLDEAAKRDVVLLFPSGLGNSLYTAPAEDEVLRAIDATEARLAVDPARVSLAGASMGGAGATTIGFHSPDRFASVTSFFGDSKYDLATYVRPILRDEAGAHLVNALDVVENARNLPVWLIHGEDDHVSPIAQSEMLAHALTQRGFRVRFDRVPGVGHSGTLVARFGRELVALAAAARAPVYPAHVSYRGVRPDDRGAYGVRLERAQGGDVSVDVERTSEGDVTLHEAQNVRAVVLAPGALGVVPNARVLVAPGASAVHLSWTPTPDAGAR